MTAASYFIDSSISPLIPGDLFHYAISAVIAGHSVDFRNDGLNCLIALLGLSIRMMLSSTTIQSIMMVFRRILNQMNCFVHQDHSVKEDSGKPESE